MEKASQLISDYLEGDLDADGAARLTELLRSDAATLDQFVIDSFVHSQLHDWMHVRQLRDELLADAFRDSESDSCFRGTKLDIDAHQEANLHAFGVRRPPRHWFALFAGLAAALLIAGSIFTATSLVSRREIVAQLTQADSCQWDAGSSSLSVGSMLHAGQPLQLKSGRAMLTFASGAKFILVGPAAAKLVSTSEVDLHAGLAGAQVPTQAIGFTVATPIVKFVDLGTEFALALESTNSCTLQVFDGLVEIQLPAHAPRVGETLRISEGSAVRFDAANFDVNVIPYDEEQRLIR
jgi:hypothetical protein